MPSPAADNDNTLDTAPRPKFSRRPASFARHPSETAAPLELDQPAESRTIIPIPVATPTPWQEDTRFGLVLLGLVLLVNIALMYGLPLLPANIPVNTPTEVTAKAPSMPSAVGQEDPGVTLYSQPENERRTIRWLNLRNQETSSNTLSISPNDMPAPTARALDDDAGTSQ